MLNTAAIAAAVGGRVGGGVVDCARVSTDTRTVAPNDLFVALRGDRFDGHDFLVAAFERGAVAALVAEDRAASCPGPCVAVADPLAALGRLAACWRARFNLPVVVIVGSNGKTTVKEMVAAILREQFGTAAVLATRGNLNNAIGLPLTVLELRPGHRAAVIELGMNHPGETHELAAIAGPTIALINNAQREHQEFMRSTAEVAREHAAVIEALSKDGTAVLNADDAHIDVWREAARRCGCRVVTFGLDHPADVGGRCAAREARHALAITTPAGGATTCLTVPGRHNGLNALGAAAAAMAAGADLVSVVDALAGFRPVAGRLATFPGRGGSTVIDDTYNANPDSVRAAIDVLADRAGPKWLVLGDMGEVGAAGPAFHHEVGAYAKDCGVDRLLAVGDASRDVVSGFGRGADAFATVDALQDELGRLPPLGATVLVKGSRFMRMERVVAMLVESGVGNVATEQH